MVAVVVEVALGWAAAVEIEPQQTEHHQRELLEQRRYGGGGGSGAASGPSSTTSSVKKTRATPTRTTRFVATGMMTTAAKRCGRLRRWTSSLVAEGLVVTVVNY